MENIEGIETVQRGLTITDERALTDETIELAFDVFSIVEDESKWRIVDLYMAVRQMGLVPEDYIDPTKISEFTIKNRLVAWRLWPHASQRKWDLTIGHYIVAANRRLQPEDRLAVLDQAEQGGLGREAMRELVHSYIGTSHAGPTKFNPSRLHNKLTSALGRGRRVYDWAAANGLPDDLKDSYAEIYTEAKEELELLHESLER